jgi:hypothetical protein
MVLFEMYLLKNRVFIILIYLLSELAFSETNSSAKQLSVLERLNVHTYCSAQFVSFVSELANRWIFIGTNRDIPIIGVNI